MNITCPIIGITNCSQKELDQLANQFIDQFKVFNLCLDPEEDDNINSKKSLEVTQDSDYITSASVVGAQKDIKTNTKITTDDDALSVSSTASKLETTFHNCSPMSRNLAFFEQGIEEIEQLPESELKNPVSELAMSLEKESVTHSAEMQRSNALVAQVSSAANARPLHRRSFSDSYIHASDEWGFENFDLPSKRTLDPKPNQNRRFTRRLSQIIISLSKHDKSHEDTRFPTIATRFPTIAPEANQAEKIVAFPEWRTSSPKRKRQKPRHSMPNRALDFFSIFDFTEDNTDKSTPRSSLPAKNSGRRRASDIFGLNRLKRNSKPKETSLKINPIPEESVPKDNSQGMAINHEQKSELKHSGPESVLKYTCLPPASLTLSEEAKTLSGISAIVCMPLNQTYLMHVLQEWFEFGTSDGEKEAQ